MASNTDKWLFIINPVAGNGKAVTYADTVNEQARLFGIAVEIKFTSHKGHASQIAQEYSGKGFGKIIAVGGDGTMNEIVQSLINHKNITLGIIPAGTSNDFIQILGFPAEFSENDWRIFFEAHTINMDVGKCNDHYFLNGMGLGFDAQVAADRKEKGGKSSNYLWFILKTLLLYKESDMVSLLNDQKLETKCFINTIAIGRRFASKYFLTPNAIANDGLLDVCMIKELSFFERINIFLKVPKGEHIQDKNVKYYQTDKIELEFDSLVPIHLDGEIFFNTKFSVTVLPKKLNIIYNPTANHYFKS